MPSVSSPPPRHLVTNTYTHGRPASACNRCGHIRLHLSRHHGLVFAVSHARTTARAQRRKISCTPAPATASGTGDSVPTQTCTHTHTLTYGGCARARRHGALSAVPACGNNIAHQAGYPTPHAPRSRAAAAHRSNSAAPTTAPRAAGMEATAAPLWQIVTCAATAAASKTTMMPRPRPLSRSRSPSPSDPTQWRAHHPC